MIGSVDKAGRVLDLFEDGQAEWGVSEVGRALALPKSSAHALLAALASSGWLTRTESNRYRLGSRVLRMSRALLDATAVVSHAQGAIDALTRRYGVTVHLAQLDGAEVICLKRATGMRSLPRTNSDTGRRYPAHCTALGKVLLAHADEAVLEGMLSERGLPRITERTIVSERELRTELATISGRGWALGRDEFIDGVWCYAAPIAGPGDHFEAAISISLPAAEAGAEPARWAALAVAAATSTARRMREARNEWEAAQCNTGRYACVAA